MFSESDRQHMSRALALAEQGLWTTMPNPRVGCVVVHEHQVVGEGWHRRAGEPHAEVLALAQAGGKARASTVYVTLEPCSHHGRTPPCADQLIEAGVRRVVAAMEDPNPQVNGQGLRKLRDAGIEVRCGLMEREARELNIGFVQRMARGLPWVRMKVAASIDGITALENGRSKWITSSEARADGHRWRARASAILTGIGTVQADNPELTVRLVPTIRQPQRVLIDSRLDVNPAAEILRGGGTLVYHAGPNDEVVDFAERAARLGGAGAELVAMPGLNQKVDLRAALQDLAKRGVNELHVESGFKLNGSLVEADAVDEVLLYFAPCLLGAGSPLMRLAPVTDLEQRRRFRVTDIGMVGPDMRVLMRREEV